MLQIYDVSKPIGVAVDFIYMFHMPAFVFVSGYFGKSKSSKSKASILKLVFLFIIFNSLTGIALGFDSILHPVYSYWYLLALIVWRASTHYLSKFKHLFLISVALAFLAGFFKDIDNTFALSRIIVFYPFYLLGYYLPAEVSQKLIAVRYSRRLLCGLVTGLLAFSIAVLTYSSFNITNSMLMMSAYSNRAEVLCRIFLFLIAFLSIITICFLSVEKRIPLISKFGANSLWIFVLHRPFALIISGALRKNIHNPIYILAAAFVSATAICILFGNDALTKPLNRYLNSGVDFLAHKTKNASFAKCTVIFVLLCFISLIFINPSTGVIKYIASVGESSGNSSNEENKDVIYDVIPPKEKSKFENSFKITFAGDLILLEDQVKRGYNNGKYDFSNMFEYTQRYISSADLAIGVFEGPTAGEKAGYSNGNYNDKKALLLNYPDQFARDVKNAGFDLVTTANNHLLDKGPSGALRTLDVFDEIGLEHIGSYRSQKDKNESRIKIVEKDNIKLAVLAYTYGCNGYKTADLINGKNSYITSFLPDPTDSEAEKAKQTVKEDFESAKKLNPDLIVVLPHVGTEFSNEPDSAQKFWFDYFKSLGADIILGDHPHVVEPVEIDNVNGKRVFSAYCPGNYANIYRKNQGDTSMLVDVYIDKASKQIIGGGIIPLYTYSSLEGNYRAVPVYDVMNNQKLRSEMSTDDYSRAAAANKLITKVVFGNGMDISSVTERYYFDADGFKRQKVTGLQLNDEMKNGTLYQSIVTANSICFVGDSVTEGTKNGGIPWYEPIEEHFPDKKFLNYSKGSTTVSYFNDNIEKIPKADLYVVAAGTNDVRYRDEKICAMTSSEYIKRIDKLSDNLKGKNSNAKIIYIAPWYSTDGDTVSSLNYSDKYKMNTEYSKALQKYCEDKQIKFINPNPAIENELKTHSQSDYLLDFIHPNCKAGVELYSKCVLME